MVIIATLMVWLGQRFVRLALIADGITEFFVLDDGDGRYDFVFYRLSERGIREASLPGPEWRFHFRVLPRLGPDRSWFVQIIQSILDGRSLLGASAPYIDRIASPFGRR